MCDKTSMLFTIMYVVMLQAAFKSKTKTWDTIGRSAVIDMILSLIHI